MVAFVCFLLASPRPAAADDVDTLFKEGSEALSKSDYHGAYEKLSKAWATRQSVDIAANLSVAERRLGKLRDAAEHIAFVVVNFPPSGNPDVKRSLEETLTELEKSLAVVTIETVQGAAVRAGDKPIGYAPLTVPLYLDPGKHHLFAEKGTLKGRTSIEASAGTKQTIRIELVETKPEVAPIAEEKDESRPIWGAAVIGGVGGAALLTGVALTITAEVEKSDADTLAEECVPVTEACRTEGQGKLDNWALFHNVSFAMYGLAAAAGLGLGLYLGLPEEESTETPTAYVVPILGPGTTGISIQGSF